MAKKPPTKKNGDRKSKSKDKPAKKLTAEQLSDNQRQELLFAHRRKLKPLLATEKMAKSAVQKAYELAKKEGITKKELELAIKLETDDGADKVKMQMEQMLRVARWIGSKIGSQLNLFPEQSKNEEAYDAGKRDALDDKQAKPPQHYSQVASQSYLEGHASGRTQINTSRAEGFKPLGAVAAALVPPVGDKPPTHVEH